MREQLIQIEAEDRRFTEAIERTMAEAVRRGGEWIACREGCTPCCIGPFAITALDAWRLRRGLAELDAAQAQRIEERAREYVARIAAEYPGDPETGELRDEDALPESFDDVPCPALDPETGRCELYAARPVTCRTFGPAVRMSNARVGVCELCFVGASDQQVEACAVEVDPEGLEEDLLDRAAAVGQGGLTIVAFALRGAAYQG
jgi:Fe-S-cluster containining protein